MARRSKSRTLSELSEDLQTSVDLVRQSAASAGTRELVIQLVRIRRIVTELTWDVLGAKGVGASSAKGRMLQYLRQNLDVVVDGDELATVSGISEYARRLRELRVEEGWQISTGATQASDEGQSLKPNEYRLVAPEPDADAARRWELANSIRKRVDISASDKILEFLRQHVGRPVTSDELLYVSGGQKEFGRRLRELRTERGFQISTRATGRPDLRPGQYVLESVDRRAEPHDRSISDAVKAEVFARDGVACRLCGWTRAQWTPSDARAIEIHHRVQHARGGSNEIENLVVLCSRCHDDVHADRATSP